MTKSQVVARLADLSRIPKTRAEAFVGAFFEAVAGAMKRGDKVEIRGFGSFSVREYGSYTGRNPKTNEPVQVRPKRLPFFRVGRELKERINRGAAPAPRRVPTDAS
jgi:integration host factor subunit beta